MCPRLLIACLMTLTLSSCTTPEYPDPPKVVVDFRESLCDPAAYPVREGLDIDKEAIEAAFMSFGEEHGEELASFFEETVSTLAPMSLDLARHDKVGEVMPLLADAAYEEILLFHFARYPSVKDIIRITLSLTFYELAIEKMGLSNAQMGSWMAFLNAAKPTFGLLVRQETRIVVAMDYGMVDIFVVTLEPYEFGWVTTAIEWWRKK